jgi:hypothetical protein
MRNFVPLIRSSVVILTMASFAALLPVSADARGHGGHGRGWGPGLGIGLGLGLGVDALLGWPGYYSPYQPYGYPYYYPNSYYYPPAAPAVTVVQQAAPQQVQVAPAPVAAPQAAQQFYYYCENPKGYYPYVRNCNAPFKPVPATPQ